MKLLAVYVKNYAHIYQDECFQFSNSHQVTYQENRLTISNCPNWCPDFYGKIFTDVTAIIGKNGSGKTSILNLIGYSLRERIQNLTIEDGKITDCYFLIYEAEENTTYYIEQVGFFDFCNISGYKKLLQEERETIFHNFYFKKDNESYKIIEFQNKLREKIVYLSDQVQHENGDLVDTLFLEDRLLIPRVRRTIISLEEWYTSYVDLFCKGIIDSEHIKITFRIEERAKDSNIHFVLQAQERYTSEVIDSKVMITGESFDDFISHHLTLITVQFLDRLKSHYEEEFIRHFFDKYNQQVIQWSKKKLNAYFKDLSRLFKRLDSTIGYSDEKPQYLELLRKYRIFFRRLYLIRDMIIPGINEFTLQLDGRHTDKKMSRFCTAYDNLHLLFQKMLPVWMSREDNIYEADDIPRNERIGFPELYTEIIPLASSGEIKLISIVGNLSAEIKEYFSAQPFLTLGKEKIYLILVDEIEKEMHIEWSRNLMNYLIHFFEQCRYEIGGKSFKLEELNIGAQLIFTTHSPFMLSDLHSHSVIKLEKRNGTANIIPGEKVFAQNIQRIINQEFFIQNCFGAYAEYKINTTLNWLKSTSPYTKAESDTYGKMIDEIGEPIIQHKLKSIYNKKTAKRETADELTNYIQRLYGNVDVEAVRAAIEREVGHQRES